jgi:spore coat protein A
MLNRRQLLAIGGVAAGAALILPEGVEAASPAAGRRNPLGHGHDHTQGQGVGSVRPHAGVPEFSVQMPVPRVLQPFKGDPDVDFYRLPIQPANVEILPGVRTPAFTYGGDFVGPTIRARTGRPVSISFGNQLDRTSNVHLHGGHVPADHDGHPMDLIAPGASRNYVYPNTQQGATLWYHDHTHHTESEHNYRGLQGFYLIDDPTERDLGLPSGQYDVPIMLRDALFDTAGRLVPVGERDTLLANGRPQPYFPVAARKYRFRLLNSSLHRTFMLNLGGAQMLQIASDGGLLPAPVPRTELGLSPAERTEIVVDFSRYPVGAQLVLGDVAGPVLRFDVVRTATDDSRVPSTLRPLPALPPATVVRDMSLFFDVSNEADPKGTINGRPFDANRVDVRIRRGTTEIWNVTNADPVEFDVPHNFHMHLVQFRVLSRDGNPPGPDDVGRKDTVSLPQRRSVQVQATFGDHLGRYMYHCHFPEHSEIGMMGQMEIVP